MQDPAPAENKPATKPAPKPRASSTKWDNMDLGAFYSGGLNIPKGFQEGPYRATALSMERLNLFRPMCEHEDDTWYSR